MKSQNPFTAVKMNRVNRNKFDLSHEKKLSLKMGNLYPILHFDTVPGDSFKVNSEVMLRVAPMLAPVMHRMNVYIHYFFVPNRLVWDEWEEFITGGEDGESEPAFPYMQVTNADKDDWAKGTLPDYFGIEPVRGGATVTTGSITFSSLPFRAYQLIYNEYYRDQNLSEKLAIPKTSGLDDGDNKAIILPMRERAWEKDYFTSALPWTQRGGEAALPVFGDPVYTPTSRAVQTSTDLPPDTIQELTALQLSGQITGTGGTPDLRIENLDSITGNVLINDLRKAARVQEWLEKSARGGSRYTEQIKSFFGVTSSDARLQRPEYLGGGKQPIVISEVLNTAGSNGETGAPELAPVGEMSGHGISVGRNNKFSRTFEEHGQIIGILNVRPKTAYQGGAPLKYFKRDKFDFYFPQFAHLGEQELTRKELFLSWESEESNETVFGYQQRYAEYKYEPSTVHGDFRDTLDYWHLSRQFDAAPFLNQTFIKCRPRLDFLAVNDGTDYLWVQIYNHVSALRPMPYFSIPTL